MSKSYWYICLLFLFSTSVVAQTSSAQLPACGLQCLLQTIPSSGCAFTDNDCICKNQDLAHATMTCITRSCNVTESLAMGRISAETCNLPSANIGYRFTTVVYTMAALTWVSVTLRFGTKLYFVQSKLFMDDYILAVCVAASGVSTWIAFSLVNWGYGKHLYQLSDEQMRQTLFFFWLGSILYSFSLGLVKIAVLCFYLRIFPYTRFRYFTWALITFIVLSTAASVIMCTFQCTPIASFWDIEKPGKCININAGAYSAAGMALASDFMTILLPVPVVRRMNMGMRKKVGVMVMFALGSAGCVCGLVRLHSLVYYGHSKDPTFDFIPTTIYSCLEGSIPIITICFPQFRRLFAHFFPNSFEPMPSAPSKELLSSSRGGGSGAAKYWFSDSAMGRNTESERDEGVGIEDLVLNDVGGILSEDEHEEDGKPEDKGTRGKQGATVTTVVEPRHPVS